MTSESCVPDTDADTDTDAAAAPRRLLVVDDDRLVLATLAHGLAEAGYQVFDADNGEDALALARAERPHLALLDIRMDGMSGLDLAERLRDGFRTPFMFLSAFCDAATARRAHDLGARGYLVKPLDVRQVVPAIDAALAGLPTAAQGASA